MLCAHLPGVGNGCIFFEFRTGAAISVGLDMYISGSIVSVLYTALIWESSD